MPTNNTSSPVRRPGLGRRAISSHAVVTTGELSHSHTQRAPAHKPRPHVVGGAHRTHSRNPSFGKNLSKLQRFTSAQHIPTEGHPRLHQRKKSAPVTPAGSPRAHHHVHWDGSLDETKSQSMKKTYSSPALRRNTTSGAPQKKALVTNRPHSSSGKKKVVGFELADSDDEGEWEDTTQSPESTRRNSVVQSKESAENPPVLIDPLTFVKRPYPQVHRATSLPEPSSVTLAHERLPQGEDSQQASVTEGRRDRPPDHGDIAARLLSPSHAAKAPPAMSSISAMVKPTAVDTISRNTSLTNMAAHDVSRRGALSSSNPASGNTPGNSVQGTSSSMEGGVSRFIVNGKAASRTDSDFNTPSSFLPHYHPQTPPSPRTGAASMTKANKASPPTRPRGAEPHSRTQQKLWLQRTAALNTTPPDSHGGSASVSPATMDPTFMAAAHARSGSGPYDPVKRVLNGSARVGAAMHDSEAKHVRKAYEKTALELAVVRRFQSPTGDSFGRLSFILKGSSNGTDSAQGQPPGLTKTVKSAPSLVLLPSVSQKGPTGRAPSALEPDIKKVNSIKAPGTPVSAAFPQDPSDLADSSDSADVVQRPKSQHPSQRILSTSDDVANGHATAGEDLENQSLPNESELMIRRMWESREVASSG